MAIGLRDWINVSDRKELVFAVVTSREMRQFNEKFTILFNVEIDDVIINKYQMVTCD